MEGVSCFVDLLYLPALVLRYRPDVVQLNSVFDCKGMLRDVFFSAHGATAGAVRGTQVSRQ
jgi:hypothetical protein